MPSPRPPATWLLLKEWRELTASRAWWILLLATGPIVGLAFTNAVRAYADLSADAGCGIVCSPLLGMWAPTFSAFEIVAIFLLPFVAIRSLSADRSSGALGIELQRPFPMAGRVAIKAVVIFSGWVVALMAGLMAVVLWAGYGGSIALPELLVVVAGHALNAGLTISLALAIAAATDHPSTAAIITLSITIGTWMLDFAAAVYGGVWEQFAAYTPAALVSMFQHGLVRADITLAAIAVATGAIALTTVWLQPGVRPGQRAVRTAVVAGATALVLALVSFVPGNWDASETRINSFAEADEEALKAIPGGLRIDIHLAPQDPRRAPFEHGPIAKLERLRPDVAVSFVARTATGLYEQADPGYGEVVYALGPESVESRALTEEAVVASLVELSGVTPPPRTDVPYRGRPLSVSPVGAPPLFYVVWPAAIAGLWFFHSRRHS